MNYSVIRYILCRVLEFAALFMILPLLVGVLYREKSALCFLYVIAGCLIVSLIGRRFKPKSQVFYAKDPSGFSARKDASVSSGIAVISGVRKEEAAEYCTSRRSARAAIA